VLLGDIGRKGRGEKVLSKLGIIKLSFAQEKGEETLYFTSHLPFAFLLSGFLTHSAFPFYPIESLQMVDSVVTSCGLSSLQSRTPQRC